MEIKGQTIILEPGEEVTIKARENAEPQPEPIPVPDYNPEASILTFGELLSKFNNLLTSRKYKAVTSSMKVYGYLEWSNYFANSLYNKKEWMFRESTYPLVVDYRGQRDDTVKIARNAMQAWLMAMELAELVPDSGETTNTQTELYKLAYEIGGSRSFPLFGGKTLIADPYAMRDAASIIYPICRDSYSDENIDTFRSELGGKAINATTWKDLGYKNKVITDAQGNRLGYQMTYLGYLVNTRLFLPDAPGERVPGTTVCSLPQPWEQGQQKEQFNPETGNYLWDEYIYAEMVKNWNMMSQTPLSEWNSYSQEKQNRLIQVGAIPRCTTMYMFSKKNVRFDGKQRKCYYEDLWADYFCFSETKEDTGLALDGPMSDLEGLWRYNATTLNAREFFVDTARTIVDNSRFATQDPNYGRCRPGCKPTLQGGERNPIHGAPENEIYNIDLTRIVSDTDESRNKPEDGFAADSPRSYVSGHSAQIWFLALCFSQMDNERSENWVRKAYEYGVCRSIGRFHHMSDVIYGRLFGAMALPLVNAMTGLKDGYDATKRFVCGQVPQGDWAAKIIIKNQTGSPIKSTGEIRLYAGGHEYGINTYLPGASATAGALYTFNTGENNFSDLDVHCEGNGFTLNDSFDGMAIDSEVRFYDYRHYNNKDCGYNCVLDTSDSRCDKVLRKAGGTYVLKITKM